MPSTRIFHDCGRGAGLFGAGLGRNKLDNLRSSPEWKEKLEELQLAKDCNAAIRKHLGEQARRKFEQMDKQRLPEEVVEEFSALTWQFRHGSVYRQSRFVYPMILKLWLTVLISIFATHVVIRADALPVTISFLDNEEALKETTNFLASQGIESDSIDSFSGLVHWHNDSPLGFDFGRFPKSVNGFYTFQSISNLTDALPQPLITARHHPDMYCYDAAILLAGPFIQTKFGPDDLAGPFQTEVPYGTNTNVGSTWVEETARDAFNSIGPGQFINATGPVFTGSRQDKRICLTAVFDSYCTLPHQTTENNLGNYLLRVLQAEWKQQGIVFPTNMEVVVCESAVLVPPNATKEAPWLAPYANCTHVGILFRNQAQFVYIDKPGQRGPYVRLDFSDKKDLLFWLKSLLGSTTNEKDHLFAIFNGSEVDSLDDIKP